MGKIKKILIANRGEIALRIMKTIRDLGIKSVAVYSEADRHSPHVKYADEALCIGSPPSAESYLLGDKIIELSKAINVDAIHPGYGFLSENADFAEKVAKNGLIFIGPSPKAIQTMGDKLAAKAAVANYDVPMVPGIDKAVTNSTVAKESAKEIGYPILIKASAGGGGKGMRVVEKESELEEQMNSAISEAQSAFGDGAVFIEKYITSPRHIEIQILGDNHGNIVHLFERECSIQRRHQKVIEEAPSPVVNEKMRKAMGEAAVMVAKACHYSGTGTVEFIIDKKMNFYFLEMNTRLQVEHPVTEMITGIDLVEQQIKVAEGAVLEMKQEDLKITGHAFEVRVYAEDPNNNFLPDIGTLQTYKRPHGSGVRVDDGFEEGMAIPIYYDPMISKLITHGKNREEARKKMLRAINDYEITGIETTLGFGQYVLNHEAFISGKFDTKFVDKHFYNRKESKPDNSKEKEIAAALAGYILNKKTTNTTTSTNGKQQRSNWKNRVRE